MKCTLDAKRHEKCPTITITRNSIEDMVYKYLNIIRNEFNTIFDNNYSKESVQIFKIQTDAISARLNCDILNRIKSIDFRNTKPDADHFITLLFKVKSTIDMCIKSIFLKLKEIGLY